MNLYWSGLMEFTVINQVPLVYIIHRNPVEFMLRVLLSAERYKLLEIYLNIAE